MAASITSPYAAGPAAPASIGSVFQHNIDASPDSLCFSPPPFQHSAPMSAHRPSERLSSPEEPCGSALDEPGNIDGSHRSEQHSLQISSGSRILFQLASDHDASINRHIKLLESAVLNTLIQTKQSLAATPSKDSSVSSSAQSPTSSSSSLAASVSAFSRPLLPKLPGVMPPAADDDESDGEVCPEKPFCCEECGKRYKKLNGLVYHRQVTHSVLSAEDPKPFKCYMYNCDKTYRNSNGLAYHLEKSHGEGSWVRTPRKPKPKPSPKNGPQSPVEKHYVCPFEGCGKAYKNANGLVYHLQKGKLRDHDCLIEEILRGLDNGHSNQANTQIKLCAHALAKSSKQLSTTPPALTPVMEMPTASLLVDAEHESSLPRPSPGLGQQSANAPETPRKRKLSSPDPEIPEYHLPNLDSTSWSPTAKNNSPSSNQLDHTHAHAHAHPLDACIGPSRDAECESAHRLSGLELELELEPRGHDRPLCFSSHGSPQPQPQPQTPLSYPAPVSQSPVSDRSTSASSEELDPDQDGYSSIPMLAPSKSAARGPPKKRSRQAGGAKHPATGSQVASEPAR
ncbi:uncharacterized protein BJ171DRAFT_248070 [Polychytrium aggregatum]|uniref:uncharacterized protein n=1 Tax=Polychytrium aggregatum TaxID=110093 RepID=UPI0022FF380E|nr:uncharacterized protein BJ171DRAFT_248070 [Polychytrium aggregatum]KAI9193677.1 hypothetical protein BJ171DRAFT_248070 [Polychytrium aggregatum]